MMLPASKEEMELRDKLELCTDLKERDAINKRLNEIVLEWKEEVEKSPFC